jgi:hypothetical protein
MISDYLYSHLSDMFMIEIYSSLNNVIIIKTEVLFAQAWVVLVDFVYTEHMFILLFYS